VNLNGDNLVLLGAALFFTWLAVQVTRAAAKSLGANQLVLGGMIAGAAHLLPKAK
jgi:hypothetical protein